ncbi:MAG: S8 family peptidase [Pyrinomonadaceae bacterium]|nr:S8 family peptidase [Phycisphaerales bacterium]
MAKNPLLGRGENLVSPLTYKSGGGPKDYPYTFAKNLTDLAPRMKTMVDEIQLIPAAAMPRGTTVVNLTLHPAFMSRTSFPSGLLNYVGLRVIGSRPRHVTPRLADKLTRRDEGEEPLSEDTPELIVAGDARILSLFPTIISQLAPESVAATDFSKLEDVRVQPISERVHAHAKLDRKKRIAWEIVLHASPSDDFIVTSFLDFVRQKNIDLEVDEQRRLYAGGLCFLPGRGTLTQIEKAAVCPFLRCVREMPSLRSEGIKLGGFGTFDCVPPVENAVAPHLRALVLDGGRPKTPVSLDRYITAIDAPGVGPSSPEYEEHGLAVSSAFLFGPIRKGRPISPPVCNLDLVRVLDRHLGANGDFEYIDVLRRVQDYLLEHGDKYDFISLCCGPAEPITDGDPSAWTATLDPIFGRLRGLVFTAIGNGGTWDRASGRSRVQPPADTVNSIGVGSCVINGKQWGRADYSCVGPGRRPGYVKPDFVCPGGSLPSDGFHVLGTAEGTAVPKQGTSLSAPYAMRTAAGVKAVLGDQISCLATKALLINRTTKGKNHIHDVGWGRIMESPSDLIATGDDEAIVIFQGSLPAGKYRTAQIPVPKEPLAGVVEITATFCIASQTDPHHPVNYTRSSLEVTFRPHSQRFDDPDQQRPDSASFFKPRDMYQSESQLRREGFKWETVLHRTRKPRAESLHEPSFDIHHIARVDGQDVSDAQPITYALVVRIRAKDVKDYYNRVYRRYRNVLVPLRPVLSLPIAFSR